MGQEPLQLNAANASMQALGEGRRAAMLAATEAGRMGKPQPGIALEVPAQARHLTFRLAPQCSRSQLKLALGKLRCDAGVVAGLGQTTLSTLGLSVSGLRPFEALCGCGVSVPSTPSALWLWLRGEDRGALFHAGRELTAALGPTFIQESAVETFRYSTGRDLTGFEDGTENPKGAKAAKAAFAADGSSFVAVQRWVHDLGAFGAMSDAQRNHVIGRDLKSNLELKQAPRQAHVKRTAQEDFDPPAFILRRSMAWVEGNEAGLQFLAFGHSTRAYEALLKRMLGMDDGLVDNLFQISRPVSGAFFWCPPVRGGRLDLAASGL